MIAAGSAEVRALIIAFLINTNTRCGSPTKGDGHPRGGQGRPSVGSGTGLKVNPEGGAVDPMGIPTQRTDALSQPVESGSIRLAAGASGFFTLTQSAHRQPIRPIPPLRDDPFEAHRTGMPEHDCAVAIEVLGKTDAVAGLAGHWPGRHWVCA
jgi:hypothetical protein